MKPPLRTKSVGTKVSEAEFALLEERARGAGMRLAEWVREALLAAPVEPVAGSGVDSRVQNTSYDQAKRLTALFDNFNSVNVDLASNFGYYPNGAVEDVYLGNSNSSQTHQHTTLNSRLQVTGRSAQVHSTDGSPTLLTLGFNYPSSPSNNGNISSESITTNGGMGSSGINVTQSFGYDAFNRILSMSETSGLSQSYGYDAYGNRALTGGYAPSPYLTPTSTSQFTGNRWLGSGSSTAGYDASGNQTQNTNGGNVFTFDAENRMVTSNIGNMGVTSYVYDGEGRRIEKTSSTFTSYYVYDFSGATVAEYTTETQPVYGTLYVTPDHLGSTRLLTNGNGDVVRRYDYLPFGEEIPSGSYSRGNDYGGNQYPNAGGTSFPGDAASHKFTGKERDWETGLDFFGARYFSGAQGRFTSADWSESPQPIPYADTNDPQTLNLYSYVRNNPLSHGDLDGHKVDCTGDNARGIGCQFLADWNAAHGVGEKAEAAVTAVGHGMEKASDFVNTAPGLGLVAGMAIFAETGGGDETPAVAEAGEEVGATLSNGANLIAQLGSKLNFLFGQSGGANFARSEGMRAALQQVGLNDTIENRVLVSENLTNALNNTGSIVSRTGDRVVRESLLMGPTGGVKLQSIWENTKLITVKVFGGR